MVKEQKDLLTLVGVGDFRPDRVDDPPSVLRYCKDAFHKANFVYGHLESPYTDRGTPMYVPHGPQRRSPKNISAFTKEGAGFDVMSFATNNTMDFGPEGLFDTLDLFRKNNIAIVGAGRNIAEARSPAIIEKKGTRVGFLAYNSIMSPGLVAEEDLPGGAPLRSSHFYQQVDYQPGTQPLIITKLYPEDKVAMENDIRKLRPQVDVVVIAMHAGLHMVRALIAMYQKEAAYAAIDAGADMVLMHHAHILKGIEVYKGKTIFYNLGNFVTSPNPMKMKSWSEFRDDRKFYHVKPIPGWEKYHYLAEARNTLIAKAYIQDKKIQKVTYIPAFINPKLEPEVVTRKDPRAQDVFDYVTEISDYEDLKVKFSWDGDEVLVSGIK